MIRNVLFVLLIIALCSCRDEVLETLITKMIQMY